MNKAFKIINYLTGNKVSFIIFIIICGSFFELLTLSMMTPIFNYFSGTSISVNFLNLENILNINNNIKKLLVIFLLIFTIRCFLSIMISYYKGKLIQEINNKLSSQIYSNYIQKDYEFFLSTNSSKLISNILFEVQKFSYGIVDSLLICFTEIFLILAVLTYLLISFLKPGMLLFIVFLIFFLIFYKYTKFILKNLGSLKVEYDRKKLHDLQISFYVIKNIKLDNLENFFFKRFKKSTELSTNSTFYLTLVGELFKPIVELFIFFVFTSIIIIFFYFFQFSKEEVFLIISLFVVSMFRVLPSFNKLFHNLNNFKFNYLTIDIIYSEIFKNNFDKQIYEKQQKILNKFYFNKSIEFKNVNFSYNRNEKKILKNVNIKITKNNVTGLFGDSGSGKTTLLNLICYLIKPTSGKIFVDDEPVENLFKSYQKTIGYVSQKVHLIDDTIINNILLGQDNDAFNNELFDQILKKTGLDNVINNFSLGKYTKIGERGERLSGGQQQRIGIARALYKEPSILILDEATSNLDEKSEKQIFESLKVFKNNMTIIIVSHKKSIMELCDKVFKVEKGIIVDKF